jgi:elongation factor Ts
MSDDLKLITQLRNQTGAGIADCKEALTEAKGNIEKAQEILRKKGAKIATKRSAKEAKEGIIYSYIHATGKVGTILELNCETDFVAKNEEFNNLAHDLAMQITAENPLYISPSDVPEELLSKEKEMIKEQLLSEGKPENMLEKIVEGKINKWYEEICLLKQPFIKDEDITVEELINEKIASIGEKIEIGSFCRKEV